MKKDQTKRKSETMIPPYPPPDFFFENNTTELVFILDKSGSMEGMEKDTVGGFNAMIEKQKKQDGKAYVTTVLFANDMKMLHDRQNLEEVLPLTKKDYTVGGCTALLDAIGQTVTHIQKIHSYARKEDVPARTVFVITTDGMENASHRYDHTQIKKLISYQKEKYGWEFLFLAANIDAEETAAGMGISPTCAANYSVEKDTKLVFNEICSFLSEYRKTGKVKRNWKKKIEEKQDDESEKNNLIAPQWESYEDAVKRLEKRKQNKQR